MTNMENYFLDIETVTEIRLVDVKVHHTFDRVVCTFEEVEDNTNQFETEYRLFSQSFEDMMDNEGIRYLYEGDVR